MASFILFICKNQNINIFILVNGKDASLVSNEIKKNDLICFWGNTKNACLICFSKKWPEKHLFIFFSLFYVVGPLNNCLKEYDLLSPAIS